MIATAFCAVALAACGSTTSHDPQSLTEATTKAVYNNDLNAMQLNFDDDLKKDVTLAQVSTISAKLKALGNYKGLTQTAADTQKGRYDYMATFENGNAAVHIRIDPSGQLAAYHVDIAGAPTATN